MNPVYTIQHCKERNSITTWNIDKTMSLQHKRVPHKYIQPQNNDMHLHLTNVCKQFLIMNEDKTKQTAVNRISYVLTQKINAITASLCIKKFRNCFCY